MTTETRSAEQPSPGRPTSTFALQEATYRDDEMVEYRGNPCIEALPQIMEKEDVAELAVYPPLYEEARPGRPQARIASALYAVKHLFQPLPIHTKVAGRIANQLRLGLSARNPLEATFWRENVELAKRVRAGTLLERPPSSQALGQLVYGDSRNGKTRGYETILNSYPKAIRHSNYRGPPLHLDQLVWLRLECPKDGSLRELALQFFRETDARLGTRYFDVYSRGRKSADDLLGFMVLVARNHALGLLVIDEIQHLLQARYRGKTALNFLVTLINYIGLPVTVIGTPATLRVFEHEFRLAGRMSFMGDIVWSRMRFAEPEQVNAEWTLMLDALEGYQYTRRHFPLTPELRRALYRNCQGITEITISLFFCVQRHLIEQEEDADGEHDWSPELIDWLAAENYTAAYPGLVALRSGRLSEIQKHGDVMPLPRLRGEGNPGMAQGLRAPEATLGEPAETLREPEGEDAGKVKSPRAKSSTTRRPRTSRRNSAAQPAQDVLSQAIVAGAEQGLDTHAALLEAGFIKPLEGMLS